MDSPTTDALNDRYPGLRSFSQDEQHLFFGRRQETDDLFDLVRAEQITVLFAKSGLGKSSLLNAGLRPKLEAINYRVIPIRFQQQKTTIDDTDSAEQPAALSENPLLTIVLTQLHGEFQAAWQGQTPPDTFNQFYDSDQEPRKLWEEIKTHPFPNGAVPVLVFDQFEELFIYKQIEQNEFMKKLAELMNDQSPTRIINELLETDVDDRTMDMMNWSKQPLVKCLFSIRADRLFEMHKLKILIPMILRNRYELLPLLDDRAREAIDKPAQADGLFTTPKFTYMEGTREAILTGLSGTKKSANSEITDKPTDVEEICEIESSQLQIVCHYIENKIKEKVARGEDAVVGTDIIENQEYIGIIIEKFYREQLQQIGTPQEIEKVRSVLENDLLVDGHRVGLAAMKMRKSLGDNETADRLINKLVEVRLIRADDTHLGRTYELSHDTLIEPVEKVKQQETLLRDQKARQAEKAEQERKMNEQKREVTREKKRRQRFQRLSVKLAVAISLAIVASLLALYFLVNGRMNLAQANRDWAVDEYNAGNQRMAYRLWESSRDLVRWIPFYGNDLVDKRADYWFAPFSGATTQFTTQHDSIQYVASLFQNNTFDLWRFSAADSTFVKFDSLYKEADMPQINAMSATKLQLQQHHLIVFKHDSLLQVFDLAANAKVFPRTPNYYPLCTENDSSTDTSSVPSAAAGNALKTVLLSPKGNWLAVLDCNGKAHLFDLRASGRPNPFFEQLPLTKVNFSLTNLQFSSTGDSVLIKMPNENRYRLLDLRMNRLVLAAENIVYARFSPAGKYLLTVNTGGQLGIRDVQTKKALPPIQLPGAIQIDELIVNQRESKWLISASVATPSASKKYTLYGLNLEKPAPSLERIATDVIRYLPFRLADHVLYATNDASITNYNINTGEKRILPASLMSITVSQTGANHVLYRMNVSSGSEKGKRYLYNVTSGKRTDVTRHLAGDSARFVFYTQPIDAGKALMEDKKLIRATPRTLTFFDVDVLAGGNPVRPESPALANSTTLKPGTLTISGPAVSIKNQDDILLSFFVNNTKNKLDYIVNHIYPPLSKGDREAAGLPAK